MHLRSLRLFRLLQLAVILVLALSAVQSNVQNGLAAPAALAPLSGPARPRPASPALSRPGLRPLPAPISRPADAPPLSCGAVNPPNCGLQVILIIDDSGSMVYNDPKNTRFQGVENMLDILAKEYYLPALDAGTPPPDIQVALVHFSSVVMNTPAWKPVNPKNLADWAVQAKAFENDITGKLNTTPPLFTDFKPALQAAAKLAADKPQTDTCPRLVMLFTDGVPNLGVGDLKGPALASYMDGLKAVVQPAFPRKNDFLYVTAFESTTYASFWTGIYQQKWQEITNDTPTANPPHAGYVPTPDLAPRMEKILGATIGTQSYLISPDPQDPTLYASNVPAGAQSLRLTYYKLAASSTFTVTGPDGKAAAPDGQNITLSGADTSIEVMTIKDPAPGAYRLKTTAPGGVVTRQVLYKPVTARLVAPLQPLLLFTSGGILIQLVDSQGQPAPASVKWLLKAQMTVSGQTAPLPLTQSGASFQTAYLPLSTDTASISACAALVDPNGSLNELFNGPVGDIHVDPIGVRADPPTNQVCVPSGSVLSVPLQLVDANTSQPVGLDSPVVWQAASATYPGVKEVKSSVDPQDPTLGAYTLSLSPVSLESIQTQLQASTTIDGQTYPFYSGQVVTSTGWIAAQKASLSLGAPQTLADSLSLMFNQWFHIDLFGNGALVLIGRHFFGWFGPTAVQVSAQLQLSDPHNNTAGISLQDFSAQLVSQSGRPNSQPSNAWQSAADGSSTITFPAPGLGLYKVLITYQGKLPDCATLADLPSQGVLLVNDFWEYLFWLLLILLLLILFLIWLIPWLLCRFRNPLYGYLGIVDESGRILWKVRLSGDEEEERGRACYDWEFEDLYCQIRRLRIRAWHKRRRWLVLSVWTPAGKRSYERSLEKWQDIEIGGCDIVWWPHDPGRFDRDDDDPDRGGRVGGVLPPPGELEGGEHDRGVDAMEVDEIILVEAEPDDGIGGPEDAAVEEVILLEGAEEEEEEDEYEGVAGPDEDSRYALETIEALDPESAARLRELEILTIYDLLDAAAARADREDLAGRSGISHELLLAWVHRADLLQIEGIGPKTLRLLESCGISTIRKLSQSNADSLFHQLGIVNAEKHILRRPPNLEKVQVWIESAKILEGRVDS